MTDGPFIERRLVGVLSSLLLGEVAFVAGRGLGLSSLAAVGGAVVVAAIGCWRLPRVLPEQLDGALHRYQLVSAVWLGLLLLCIVALGRLTWFMVEPSAVQHSVLPSSAFMTRHSCLTAYLEGARFATSEPNCYESGLYRPGGAVRRLDGFNVDPYLYPPPFLLLPAGVRLLCADFLHQRMLWYAIDLACVVAAMLVLARWIGGNRGLVVGLLIPAVLVSVPTRISLQIGNFQLMAAAFAVLAMVAFERQRTVGGAALLAFTTVSKLFPGVLLIYLLGRRRFRAVALTFGFIALYAALTLLVFGRAPFRSFVDSALPEIVSGSEWGQTREAPWLKFAPWGVAINNSVPGLVYKLGLLGAPPAKLFVAAKVFAWIYTLALIVAAFALGRATQGQRLQSARTWLALLGLASLQAPFLPQEYALFLPLWLLAVVAAGIDAGQKSQVMAAIVGWAGLNLLLESESFGRGLVHSLIVTTIPQAIAWGLLATVVVHSMRKGRSNTAMTQ